MAKPPQIDADCVHQVACSYCSQPRGKACRPVPGRRPLPRFMQTHPERRRWVSEVLKQIEGPPAHLVSYCNRCGHRLRRLSKVQPPLVCDGCGQMYSENDAMTHGIEQ